MALYGALVNTTVTHLLIESLRMLFSRQNKILQIVVTLLIVRHPCHVQTVIMPATDLRKSRPPRSRSYPISSR